MKKILLISPFPPAQNPRLVKEYELLKSNGFNVQIIFSTRDKWANNIFENNLDIILVGGEIGSFMYYFTRFIHKLLKKILPIAFIYNRCSWLLYLKAISIKADLYIAHNLAALPIAVKAAKYHNAKCGFDAEDFHRQEVTNNINSNEYKQAKYLEDKYLPKVNYITAASPLIATEYKKLYPNLNPVVINNVFSKKYILNSQFPILNSKLNLFWFSQTVGKNRGIEDVILALNILNNPEIELHLLGNCSSEIKNYFLALSKSSKLFFYQPIAPNAIFEFASQFDIGLALELNTPFNRDICLTNKLFTYLNSGLAIVASETQAQKQFIEKYATIGKSYIIGDIDKLSEIIKFYFENKTELLITKNNALKLAQNELNWEIESKKLIEIINYI